MDDKPDLPEKPSPQSQRRKKTDKPEPVVSDSDKPKRRSTSSGDNYDLSGDFRGAVINIKSTIVSNAEVEELENLPPEPGEPPYQGLQYYDEKDADRFFGREKVIAKIVGRLATSPFLAVIGASGSGKSSVVRAGVIPALRRGERLVDGSLPPTDSGQWDIRTFTPGAHPLDSVAASLTREAESVSAATALRADLANEPRALGLIARRLLAQNGKKRLMLVIDQFEEVFTQCRQDDERAVFIRNLLEVVDPADSQPVTILLTLRADFYAQLVVQDQLRELVSQNQEFIGAMSREDLTLAILQPAALGNWKVQEGLVDVILGDLGGEPGALPLLSHALLETWKRRRGRVLTVSGYTASGGVQGAIAQTAETVFRQRLTPEQQPIARMIFIKLAEIGEGALDTRRRATFSELITKASDPVIIDAVLGILTDARLITTDTLEPGDTRVVEVAHEALIREWPTLRDWLNQNRDGLILHRQMTEDTNDWIKLGCDPGALYRGVRLQQMLDWAKTNIDLISLSEQEFLDASRKVANEESGQSSRLARARKVELTLTVTAGFVVITVVALILIYVFNPFAPQKMSGLFNIAVAEFGETGPDGVVHTSKKGKQMSEWVVTDLRKQLNVVGLQVWPDESNIFRRPRVPLVQSSTAQEIATQINAHLLIYGVVDSSTNQLILNFYVAPMGKYQFEDLQGNMAIMKPIPLDTLGDLQRQSNMLGYIVHGIALEQLGEVDIALSNFEKADQDLLPSEIIKFFLGREYLYLAEFKPDQREEDWQKAENAFQQAIGLNDQYAKPYLGLGSVYIKRSSALLDAASVANQPVDPQALQLAQQGVDTYEKVLKLKPGPGLGDMDQEMARLALGNAYRQKGSVLRYQGDMDSAQRAFDQAIQSLDEVVPILESSVPDHESYRRYLVQAHEYLASVYQVQGSVFEQQPDLNKAMEAYQKSIDQFEQCVKTGQGSPDLIIRDDILAKICQPRLEKVRQIYNDLSGGN